MANIKIQNTALLDLGTSDIIQPEVSYKRKNMLQYKGLLSNSTYRSGSGFLSTTGKPIRNTNNNVTIGDRTYTFSSPFATDNTEIDANYVVAATSNYSGSMHIMWAEQAPNNNLIFRTNRTSTSYPTNFVYEKMSAIALGDLSIFVGITSTGYLHIWYWRYDGGEPSYVLSYALPSNITSRLSLLRDITLAQVSMYNIAIGIDSTAMQSRYTYVYTVVTNRTVNSQGVYEYTTRTPLLVETIHGFGCVSEDGKILTGEPLPVQCLSDPSLGAASMKFFPYARVSNFDYDNVYSFTYDSTMSTAAAASATTQYDVTTLDNDMLQYEKVKANQNNVSYYSLANSGVQTATSSWANSVKGLGVSSLSVGNAQEGSDLDWFKQSITFMKATATENVQLAYGIYAYWNNLGPNSATYSSPVFVFMRAQWANRVSAGVVGTVENNRTSTFIGHIDVYNPMGQVGENALANDGLQLFPHYRFFFNSADDKGKTWDYGRGWARFLYGSYVVRDRDNVGFQIMEHPMQLITIDGTCPAITGTNSNFIEKFKSQTMDALLGINVIPLQTNADVNSSYRSSTKFIEVTNAWIPEDSDSLVIEPTTFYKYINYTCGPNGSIVQYPMLGRFHGITENTINSTSWYWGHTMGSLEITGVSEIPFRTFISTRNNGKAQVIYYDNAPIAIAYNTTLLFTPRDLSGDYIGYNINYISDASTSGSEASFIVWDNGKIQAIRLSTSATAFSIEKMADYIFKTNSCQNSNNVFSETHGGNITQATAFISYSMDCKFTLNNLGYWLLMPTDGPSYGTNNVYYYGAGINPNLDPNEISTSFLLPSITIPFYSATSDLATLQSIVLQSRKGLITAVVEEDGFVFIPSVCNVDQYWTFSQYSTDNTYKVSIDSNNKRYFDDTLEDTSWWPDSATTIYPIGIASKTYGENYITATVDTGNNYVSRFYNQNNKTFLAYNNASQVYYGSEIFTIQSGNYYFDGQGIYYLGSQSDYSQNIFTAYAIGMKFLANSSSEAYFYSEWDKSLYLYTASNTLQKSISLADCGNIVDALYSSAEQALYILFDDNKIYIKTQVDDCFIDGISSISRAYLQSTEIGCQEIAITSAGSKQYQIVNPYRFDGIMPFELETEWIGNSDVVTSFHYADIIFYTDNPSQAITIDVYLNTLNGDVVKEKKRTLTIKPSMWKNKLYRERIVPAEPIGNAAKLIITSSDSIKIMSMTLATEKKSELPSAPRAGRV